MLDCPITINKGEEMDYNLIMYWGIISLCVCFYGFIYYEMILRDEDRKQAETDAFINAVMRKDIK